MFAMLFTVGASYFLFTSQTNQAYIQSLVTRGNSLDTIGSEDLLVTTGVSDSNHVEFYVNNTGGVNSNVTTILVYSTSGTPLQCVGKNLPAGVCTAQSATFSVCANPTCSAYVSPAPSYITDNVGKGTSVIDTGYTYASMTVTVKIITSRGAEFSQTYPLSATELAAQALSSGAIGDLYMAFSSYTYYSVTSGGGCPASGGGNSGYCLTKQGAAFSIPYNFASNIAFAVQVTNLNPSRLNITLDQYSLINHVVESGSGAVKYYVWYIVGNHTSGAHNVINSTFTSLFLPYNKPVTLVFASASPVAQSGFSAQSLSQIKQGSTAPVFIVSHGWKGLEKSKQTSSSANYGQNSPYVTTLYY
jgi:hypothetical protein